MISISLAMAAGYQIDAVISQYEIQLYFSVSAVIKLLRRSLR